MSRDASVAELFPPFESILGLPLPLALALAFGLLLPLLPLLALLSIGLF